MTDYAWRKKWDEELSSRVLGKLREKGYLDDVKFARFWLRARTGGKPRSKRKISAEMSQKGVKKEIIDEVLKGYTDEQELESLQALVDKKQSKYPDRQKFIAYLARRGYSFDNIKKAIDI